MTIAQWLVEAMIKLKQAGVDNGRTDGLILLTDLFQKDRSWVHGHPEHELDDLQIRELNYKLNKRLDRLPLAYIRGFVSFYGRKFTVNKNVMIPRPESESFIEILKLLEFENPLIADIGTGSGILGITAALELADAEVDLYDISAEALAVCQHNALQYKLDPDIIQSDLLSEIKRKKYDIFLANLPYVPAKLITSPEITTEPQIALFSGEDGLDHYRKFWNQTDLLATKPKYILTESLQSQHLAVQRLAAKAGFSLDRTDVLVQLFKKI